MINLGAAQEVSQDKTAREHGDDTYDIVYYRYSDGERVRETRVAKRLIRKLGVY